MSVSAIRLCGGIIPEPKCRTCSGDPVVCNQGRPAISLARRLRLKAIELGCGVVARSAEIIEPAIIVICIRALSAA